MPRVLLFGAAWIVLLAALLIGLRPGSRPDAARPFASSDARALRPKPPPPPLPPAPREGDRYPGWTVTKAYSAHYAMIVEVETDTPETALQIAAQIVEPIKDRYQEVLLYARDPDSPADALPARRVQWTRGGGYVEMIYAR